jgi:hypothetical protein
MGTNLGALRYWSDRNYGGINACDDSSSKIAMAESVTFKYKPFFFRACAASFFGL